MAKKQKIARKSVKKVKSKSQTPLVVKQIQKRDGTRVAYDEQKIVSAIFKAMKSAGEGTLELAERIAKSVQAELLRICLAKGAETSNDCIPTVEDIQDVVEKQLIFHHLAATAKNYILYREKRNELRRERGEVPAKVRELANESKKYFQNDLSEFIYYRSYSRWIDEEGRRETWVESVERYLSFMKERE